MALVFADDQLGKLVLNHIQEQTKRFETSEDRIRLRTDELRQAQQEHQVYQQQQQLQQRSSSGSGTANHNHNNATTSSSRQYYSPSSTVAPPAAPLRSSNSREGSSLSAHGYGGMNAAAYERGTQPTSYTTHQYADYDDEPHTAAAAGYEPQASSALPYRNSSSAYDEAERFTSALNEAPVIIGLAATTSRVERQLSEALSAIHELLDRVKSVEDENRTLRLEVRALREAQDEQKTQLHDVTVAVSRSTSSSPTSAAAARRVTSSTEAQALLQLALTEDATNAAAVIIGRRAGDPQPKETVCDQCFAKGLCSPCSGCASEWYCSTQCALIRREKHRAACDMLRTMREKQKPAAAQETEKSRRTD